ncbi:MAG: hypothetical protein IJY79_07455 [Clostridia bacterium]|nr:hypothetical protein [Clostridia bacterium]
MLLKNKIIKLILIIMASFLILLIIIFPDISSSGVSRGLLISANVIIPSLFPFMVCVLMIIKSGISIKNKYLQRLLKISFGQNFNMFFVFILSMLGGYPVGARMINELYNKNAIDKKSADIMLMYCVNAGPAFIISAVGKGIFNSYKIGIVLLISHLVSSFIIAFICARHLRKSGNFNTINDINLPINFSEKFVTSVADAASSILQICSFVIIFSAINAYLEYFFADIPIIRNIIFFTEVTSAVTKTNNIILVSFLLGFSGLSIWCQIIAMTGKRKINFSLFAFGRLLHGGISSTISYFLIKYFDIKISTYNNSVSFFADMLYGDISVSVSLLTMFLVLLTYIYTKNNSGKIIKDVV